jgi:hypothetical protein
VNDDEKTRHGDGWMVSDFVSAVLERGKFLVGEHQFQQLPPAIVLGGREVSIDYANETVSLSFCFEIGSPPWVAVDNLKRKQKHGLISLIERQSPQRADRIHKLWYNSRRSAVPIEIIVEEYVDFLRAEGTAALSADFTDWPDD